MLSFGVKKKYCYGFKKKVDLWSKRIKMENSRISLEKKFFDKVVQAKTLQTEDGGDWDRYKKEYQQTGFVRDPSSIREGQIFNPWQFPEDPFDYVGLVSSSIGVIPSEKVNTKVAIIGGGVSGLVAAFELLKVGVIPVIYESSERLGGRNYSYKFPGDPNAFAELGAMRIPQTHYTAFYYLKYFGIKTKPFPDPLKVPTMIYFNQKASLYKPGDSLPKELQNVSDKWCSFISPIIQTMQDNWSDPIKRSEQWMEYVKIFAGKSFSEVLREIRPSWTPEEISLFGSMGVGTGGFDSLFQISFIEILRILVCQWEDNQELLVGGTRGFEDNFWNLSREGRLGNISVAQANGYTWRKGVKKIQTNTSDPNEPVLVTDNDGNVESYVAVILTPSLRAIETGIEINDEAFSLDVWKAIRDVHQIASGKVFVRTETAFWDESLYPEAPRLYMTITDAAFRQLYLFQFENTNSGVICLSYTWGDSALKFDALSEEKRINLCVNLLSRIYPNSTIEYLKKQIKEIKTWQWEESVGYHGAFKLTYPGQYDRQWALFNQTRNPSKEYNNGLYLAGESTSWAGGWIEGALHSGLNAAMSVILRLGGTINLPESSLNRLIV